MSVQQTQLYCKACDKKTLAQRPEINHALHLLLSVLTLGIWIIIWILITIRVGGWRCQTCGSTIGIPVFSLGKILIVLFVFLFFIGYFNYSSYKEDAKLQTTQPPTLQGPPSAKFKKYDVAILNDAEVIISDRRFRDEWEYKVHTDGKVNWVTERFLVSDSSYYSPLYKKPIKKDKQKLTQTADRFEILNTKIKVIKRYTDWTKCAWLVELANNTDKTLSLNITIDYLDKDGFKLDDSVKYVDLGVSETKTFSDTCPPFLNEVFDQISSFNVTVKEN